MKEMQSQYTDSPNLAGVSSLNRQRLTLIKSVQPQKLFGARPAWIGSHQVDVTDPSRTIVDNTKR